MLNFIKKIIYNKSFVNLYQMEYKGRAICDEINNCNFEDDSKFVNDIKQLYSFVLSEIELTKIQIENTQREVNGFYRQKRVKIKDEETNKKTIEKIKVQKKGIGFKREIQMFNNDIDKMNEYVKQLEDLALSLENHCLDTDQLLLCDVVISNNRINPLIYKIGMALIILLIVFAIVSMIY